ncbi:NADP-dependent oxidoreductase, partial [Streptomyces sp. SID10116]|nr:NADP-dependent oxidoreductase [Streptomyces sp. SID10116]
LRAGQRALIHAAAGGVGHLAVQIAKAHGAYVIGTARADKHEFLRSLGADEVVDYTRVDFTEAVRDVDVVLDGVGGAYGARSLEIIRPGGHLVTLPDPGGLPDPARAAELGVHTGWTIVEPDRAGLLEITRLVDEGKLRVEIDTIIPLEEAAKAHARGERGRTQGKIVLSVV